MHFELDTAGEIAGVQLLHAGRGAPPKIRGIFRVNIQNEQGKAKAYQVRQVLNAIDRWEEQHDA